MTSSLPEGLQAPNWLIQLAGGDLLLQGDALALLAVANFPKHGSGAMQVLECLATCLEALHREEQLEAAYQWARTARRLVSLGFRLTAQYAHVNAPTDREFALPVWGPLLRLAEMARPARGLHVGVSRLAGHLLLGQLHRTRSGEAEAASFKPLAAKAAARLAACAQACLSGSTSETASSWLNLVQLPEFTEVTLRRMAVENPVGEVRAFAQTLARALDHQARTELPFSQQPIVIGTSGHNGPPPVLHAKSSKRKLPRKERPGAAGLLKTASYSSMAEAFGVYRYWHWLAPEELKAVTRDLVASLQVERINDDTADFALLSLVSLVIGHDHRCTLKLPLHKNDDFWFCPTLGCVFVDRGVLLDLSGARGSHGYVLVVFPRIVVEAIRRRVTERPNAQELGELMRQTPDDAWLSAVEHFVRGLGDSSHPPCSARLSRSLGPSYIATGTPRVVAAQQTLNWGMGPDSAPSYYGVPASVANSAAARAFEWLELGPAEELPADMWSGRPDIPGDDEIRSAWALTGEPVRQALETFSTAPTVEASLQLFNTAMVACWRALPLADAGRPQRPDSPRVADATVHPRWCRRDDKDTHLNGARLLLRSAEVADVLSAAIALRQMLIVRLRALGVREAQLPRTLTADTPAASLFVEVAWKADGSGRLVARSFGDKLLKEHPAPWKGPANLGRVYWISESVVAPEPWAEQLLSGHGRNLAHTGSVALSGPVMDLLEGCAPFVRRTLQRLALPRFAGGLHAIAPLRAPELDLRFVDRRGEVRTRPKDIPKHHVDSDTLPALVVIEECLAELGRGKQMPSAARVLMSMICASGLIHSGDVAAAWSALASKATAPDAAWLEWQRPSRQRICMPKQPKTWVATDLCGDLPPLAMAEAELRKWLTERFPAIQWPHTEGATVVAMCYLAARWVRLHVPPFLVEAYRPEVLAAVFDDISNQRLCLGDPRRDIGLVEALRPRQSLRAVEPPANTDLQQVMALLRKHTRRHVQLGGHERRARRIGRLLRGRFDLEHASPVAEMVISWLLHEAGLWEPRSKGRIVPSTWAEYLRRMLPLLEQAEREKREPLSFGPKDWLQLGGKILDIADVKDADEAPRVWRERRHALVRMTLLLARDANYPDARSALGTRADPPREPRYRPAKASALVTNFDIETGAWLLQLMRQDWPLASLQHEAQLRVTFDTCARADESNALAMTDISADRRQAAFRPHNFTHLKREWNHRTNGLRPATTAVLQKVVELLTSLPKRPKFIFSQQDSVIDLRLGRAMQARNAEMLRQITGNECLAWHALRGAGLMQRLAPGWELDILAYLQGPLLLRHAQSLMEKLAGTSVSHFADALGCSGHLSPGVPIKNYLTAWPYWYSCAMRTATSKVRVSPELADTLPGGSRQLLSTINCRYRTEGTVDDWAWAVKLVHFQGWRKDRNPLQHLVLPRVAASADDRPVPAINQARYLLLRSLHFGTVNAAQLARIAHSRALDLERHGVMLRRFEEVHFPADGNEASKVARDSAARLLDKPIGQALFGALAHAPGPVRDVLRGWLEGAGPAISGERVKTLLRALPTEVGLDIGWGQNNKCVDLIQPGPQEPRLRTGPLPSHTGAEPRVRLFQRQGLPHPGDTGDAKRPRINEHRAALLTALARLTVQTHPQPFKKDGL